MKNRDQLQDQNKSNSIIKDCSLFIPKCIMLVFSMAIFISIFAVFHNDSEIFNKKRRLTSALNEDENINQDLNDRLYIKQNLTQSNNNSNNENVNQIKSNSSILNSLKFRPKGNKVMGVYDQSYDIKLSRRTKLQQPKLNYSNLIYWKIVKKSNPKSSNIKIQPTCILINSVNIFTRHTSIKLLKLLKFSNIGIAYIVTNANDRIAENQIQKMYKNQQIQRARISFDSNFRFNIQIKKQCDKLIYMFGNYQISTQMANNIVKQAAQLPLHSLYFTSKVMKKNQTTQLTNLANVDLSKLQPKQFYSYLYIFDTQFLDIITPTNFVYYTKYTLEQIILIPLLIVYQSAKRLITSDSILHKYSIQFIQFKQFPIQSPKKQDNAICFISYPINLYQIQSEKFQKYFEYFQSYEDLQNIANVTIIVYLPYKFPQSKQILDIISTLSYFKEINKFFRIKLRILNEKISPGYAIYDSVHSYCPKKSLIVSSRHNVIFNNEMAKQILEAVNTKYHYYFFSFISSFYFIHQAFPQENSMNQSKLLPIQVFKSDLFKMVPMWILKSAQVDFYETQFSFIRHIMQIVNYTYYEMEKTLANVQDRKFSKNQIQQINNIRLYGVYFPLNQSFLLPYEYNSLHNSALRRNAPQKISRLIHQIWLGKSEISKIRMVLYDSIIKTNPNFIVKLWKFDDINQQNFPITYNFIQMVLQKHKQWYRSLYAMVSALMRYEIILNLGGIYLDFKFEGRKPLDNFLKYQLFFIDINIEPTRFGSPKALGNGAMGAIQNNYHLKFVLNELITQKMYTFEDYDLPWITGAYILRKSVTDSELFTQISFGFHFFVAVPYQNATNFCGGVNRKFDQDQQIFTVKYSLSDQKMSIGFPCKMYPEAYIILYTPLSQTWIGQKTEAD